MREKHKIKYRIRLLFSLLVFALTITNRAPGQSPFFKQVIVSREDVALTVNTLYTDHFGFLWIGTTEGLYQSDGIEYSPFLLADKKTANDVSALYEDKNHTLWVGYKNGNIAFLKNDSLQLLNSQEGFPKKAITDITSDKKGALWFSTAGEGVYYYLNNRFYNIDDDDGLNDNYTYSLVEDAAGSMWVGTDQGIAVCTYASKNKIVQKLKTPDGLPDEIVSVLRRDDEGNIWIGMGQKGICKYNTHNKRIETYPCFLEWKNGAVNDIYVSPTEIWIATEDSGLVYCERNKEEGCLTFQSADNIKFGKVTSLTRDKQKNMWLSCDAGLIRSTGMWLTFLNSNNGEKINYVHALLIDAQGNIFYTPDQGLVKIPSDKNLPVRKFEITPVKEDADIVSMYEDDYGYVWIGTLGAGLYRLNPSTGIKQKIDLPAENLSVLSIAGHENEIWLGTFGGVVKITINNNFISDKLQYTVAKYDHQKEIGNYYIYCVFIDSKKRVWFGSDQKGLACYDNGKFSNPYSTELKDKTIYSIAEDKAGNIWCSVADEGVIMLGVNGVKKWGTSEGLHELSVTSICPLDVDRLALVHKRGVDIINVRTKQVDYYGGENNLDNINPDLNAWGKDKEGKIWLGTEAGIIVLNPLLNVGALAPQVVIKRVALYSSYSYRTQEHFFSYDENAFAFEYTGLWFTDPSRINYQYKLEGFNDNWIDTKDKRIVFPNLSPGEYVFKVRASIHKNFINSSEASYSLFIAQPYWKENWFRISGTIILAFIIYYLIKKRDERLRRLEVLKKEKIEFQFETLKSQVNPHFLFNSFNTLIAVIEDDKTKAIDYVEKLSDFFRIIVNYKDKQIISVEEELQIAKNYFDLQQKRFGRYFTLETSIDKSTLNTVVPPLVLQILLENVIKHNSISSETPLAVKIYSDAKSLIVTNNINQKRTAEPSTGTGLQNIMNRYKLLTKEQVQIIKGDDVFTVSLPLIKKENT